MSNSLRTHNIEQFLAFALEVQVGLFHHKISLINAGWDESEAWVLCQGLEERMLGPIMIFLSEPEEPDYG